MFEDEPFWEMPEQNVMKETLKEVLAVTSLSKGVVLVDAPSADNAKV